MAYAAIDDLLLLYDARIVGDLLADEGQRIDASDIEFHPTAISALEFASGEVKSAACVANRYTLAELDTLAKSRDPFLVKLVCDLTMAVLYTRRNAMNEAPPQVVEARNWLALLRTGERILNVEENKDAGTPQGTLLTAEQRSVANTIADRNRFFPTRGSDRSLS